MGMSCTWIIKQCSVYQFSQRRWGFYPPPREIILVMAFPTREGNRTDLLYHNSSLTFIHTSKRK